MVKALGNIYLNKKFSTTNLNSKVGKVVLQAGKNDNIKTGAYQGAKLKTALKTIGAGKSRGLLEKRLREHGVTGSQIGKRKAIMDLAFGNQKGDQSLKGGKTIEINGKKVILSRKKIASNLRLNAQKAGGFRGRQSSEVQFGGGKALVTSIGAITNRSVPGAGHIGGNAKELGVVKEQTAGFAIQKVNNTKPTGGPSPKAPPAGIRPIGL